VAETYFFLVYILHPVVVSVVLNDFSFVFHQFFAYILFVLLDRASPHDAFDCVLFDA